MWKTRQKNLHTHLRRVPHTFATFRSRWRPIFSPFRADVPTCRTQTFIITFFTVPNRSLCWFCLRCWSEFWSRISLRWVFCFSRFEVFDMFDPKQMVRGFIYRYGRKNVRSGHLRIENIRGLCSISYPPDFSLKFRGYLEEMLPLNLGCVI